MKNVIKRNGTFYFRISVPKDCQSSIDKREITQSLKTTDPLEAAAEAKKLTAEYKARFAEIRNAKAPKRKLDVMRKRLAGPLLSAKDYLAAFYDDLISKLEKDMPEYLFQKSNKKLRELSEYYANLICTFTEGSEILDAGSIGFDPPVLGLTAWTTDLKKPGLERRRRRVFVNVLRQAQRMIDAELGVAYSKKDDAPAAATPARGRKIPARAPAKSKTAFDDSEISIFKIAELMVDSKKRSRKTPYMIRRSVRMLSEWCDGRTDIRTFKKADLISFVKEFLPYMPKNGNELKCYRGVSLHKRIEMVKKNPDKFVPVSQTTCKNYLTVISSVFNYAKDQLGSITINPAKGLEVQGIGSVPKVNLNFSPDELANFWTEIQKVRASSTEEPERFWVPVISLYHGLRLNEICSLFLKDVYLSDDNVWVIDVNRDGLNKRVKNKPSVRVVPIHAFVLNGLGFLDYIKEQQAERSDGLLFPGLTFTDSAGYGRRISQWFYKWKRTWLPESSLYKNFHGFRYTFIQTAQNQAKMSDRCAHEITGHEIPGVSSVHLGYSGRLKPAALLEELDKLRYGWE